MAIFYDKEVRIYKTECGPYGNNAYLLVCPETLEGVIIDAPMDPGPILSESEGISIKHILLTHNHQDHLFGLKEIMAATGGQFAIHDSDNNNLPVQPSYCLDDNQIIHVGKSIQIKVIHTPGHTPGSTCFLVGDHLFTGDTLFPGGPGRTSSHESLEHIIYSITSKIYTLGDNVFMMPGHGEHSSLGISKEEYAIFIQKDHPPDLSGDVLWTGS